MIVLIPDHCLYLLLYLFTSSLGQTLCFNKDIIFKGILVMEKYPKNKFYQLIPSVGVLLYCCVFVFFPESCKEVKNAQSQKEEIEETSKYNNKH